MTMSAAELVRTMRTMRGVVPVDAAWLSRVSPSTISRIESGKLDPTWTILTAISRALGFIPGTLQQQANDDNVLRAAQLLQEGSPELGRGEARVRRLAAVGGVSWLGQRKNARRIDMSDPLPDVLEDIAQSGQRGWVSALEAVDGTLEPRSFTPVIYVADPGVIVPTREVTARTSRVGYLLPLNRNSRTQLRQQDGIGIMTPQWGVMDALSTTNRTADLAMAKLGYRDEVWQ